MEQNQKTIKEAQMFGAVDVGTTKIVALVGYKNENGQIVVLGKSNVPSQGMWAGEVMNVEETTKAIQTAVSEARNEAGFFPKKVIVGVAGRHIQSCPSSVPLNREANDPITKKEIEDLKNRARNISFESDQEIINVIPRDFVIDGNSVKNPVGCVGRHVDANYHVILGKVKALTLLRQCVINAGLDIDDEFGLHLEPLASADAVLKNDEREVGTAIIDIGGGTTDIAIYKNNVLLHTAVVPMGGNLLTKDISTIYGIPFVDAEKIKIQYGTAIKDFAPNTIIQLVNFDKEINCQTLAGIIQSRLEEIFEEASYEIGLSGYKDDVSSIVVTGGGSEMQNINQLMNFKLPRTSRKGAPTESIVYNDVEFFNNPIYSTAAGLLMRSCAVWESKQVKVEEKKVEVAIESPVEKPQAVTEQLQEQQEQPKKPSLLDRWKTQIKKTLEGVIEGVTEDVNKEY